MGIVSQQVHPPVEQRGLDPLPGGGALANDDYVGNFSGFARLSVFVDVEANGAGGNEVTLWAEYNPGNALASNVPGYQDVTGDPTQTLPATNPELITKKMRVVVGSGQTKLVVLNVVNPGAVDFFRIQFEETGDTGAPASVAAVWRARG